MTVNAKKIILFFVISATLASAFSFQSIKTYAASATGVYGGISPSALLAAVDDVEDDFNGEAHFWSTSDGYCENRGTLSVAPYSSYEGGGSLFWEVGAVTPGDSVTMSKTVAELTETSYYHSFSATFFIPKEAGGATVKMKIVGSRGTITETKTVDGGKWQTVFFETDAKNRGKVIRVEFTFTVEKPCDLYILADVIGGCWGASDINAARYMAASFTATGCTVEYDRNVTVSLFGGSASIAAKNVTDADLGQDVGLRVNLINHSSCRTLTLKYKTEGSEEYDREITSDVPDSDREVTLLFKIPEEKITGYMLCFDGAPSGDVEIISIGPSPCYEEIPSIGDITECRIARDLKNVSVKGYISVLDGISDGKVLLYALMPSDDNSVIANLREPLAEARIKNGEFSFTVTLDRDLDGIFKKYVAAVRIDGELTVICEPSYINNPELLATERTLLPESKKGIRPLPDNYVLYGIAQTALDIDLTELVASDGKNTVTHTVGTSSQGFSLEYLNTLDEKMREYEKEGIKVRFVYKLKASDGIIAHPDAAGGNAAINTKTSEGINALRVLTDMLVRRYGSSGGVTDNLVGIVLGASVNDAYDNYNLGSASLSEFARSYSAALRTVYNASVSVTSGFEVSAALGGSWSLDIPVGQRGSFDARSVLEAVSDCITAGGDINWKLAYDITPELGKYAYNESGGRGVNAERITAANLETLTEFFALPQFQYNGASRSILLLGDSERKAASATEEKALTADYIYTFLRISDRTMKNVSGYIPSHEADYDGALKYVGTDIFASKTAFASELIGKERFEQLAGVGAVTDRSYFEAEAIDALPAGIKGESVIFNLKKKNVMTPSLRCISAESGISYGERKDWGRIRLGEADGGALCGVVMLSDYPLDLSRAPYISFDFIVSSLPEGVDSVNVTVALYSKNNVAVASTSVSVNGISTVKCDMSAFSHLSSCDRMGIYITGEDGGSIGEPMILVSSVKAHSETLSGERLDKAINALAGEGDTVSVYAVVNLTLIALAALTALAVRIVVKTKCRTETSDGNE